MRTRTFNRLSSTTIWGALLAAVACSGGEEYPPLAVGGGSAVPAITGGAPTGGAPAITGGVATGGVATGGVATGGIPATTGGSPAITGGASANGGSSGGGLFSQGGSNPSGGKGGSSSGGGRGGSTSGGGRGGSSSAGSTSVGGSMTTGTVAYSQVQGIVQTRCTSCHNGGAAPNLGTAALYNSLTTVAVSRCGGNKLVTASDPTKSALILIVTGKCGSLRMPVGCSGSMCIPQAEIDTLTAWIRQGAKNM